MSLPSDTPRRFTIVRDRAEHDPDCWVASIREGPVEVARAEVYGDGTPSHKNALLLAAAPELYAGCQVVAAIAGAITAGRLLPTSIDWARVGRDLRRALASADGRTP
jgi:hypothetical protein